MVNAPYTRLSHLPGGIYAPIPTAFTHDEELDVQATVRHALRMARSDVGLVVGGSTGEAITLTDDERSTVLIAIRKALLDSGLDKVPVVAGTGAGSVRQTVAHCRAAERDGADAVIVIAPGYFSGALMADRAALRNFFVAVADASPLPVMLYNFPAASGGIDLDTELLEELAAHPNVCGAKLTCAGVGKAGRLANSANARKRHDGGGGAPFHVFPGFADIILPCMLIGASGAIVGTANVIPLTCVEHARDIDKLRRAPTVELLKRVQAQQDLISRFDRALSKGGVQATKHALQRFYYGQGPPRAPLRATDAAFAAQMEPLLAPGLERERALEKELGVKVDTQRS